MLRRFWFQTTVGLGYGVTAHSVADATDLLRSFGYPTSSQQVVSVIADVDTSTLDQEHVIPNAGPVVVRGIWYPRHNV